MASRRGRGDPEQPRRPAALDSIVNGPNSVVVSGAGAVELLDELEKREESEASVWDGVKARPLRIPFPAHSHELEPSLCRLRERARLHNLWGHQDPSLPVYGLSGTALRSKGVHSMELVSAMQLTMSMDFPAVVAQAVADRGSATHFVDFGPGESSIARRLMEEAFEEDPEGIRVVSAVAVTKMGLKGPLRDRMRDVACSVLALEVSNDAVLTEAGVSSQMMSTLSNRLSSSIPECAGRISVASLFDHPSLQALERFVLAQTSGGEGEAEAPGGVQGLAAAPGPGREASRSCFCRICIIIIIISIVSIIICMIVIMILNLC